MRSRRPIVNVATGEVMPPRAKKAPVFNKAVPQKKDWFNVVEGEGDASDVTKVYIYDEIGFWGTDAAGFIEVMAAIDTPNIELHLNSPGGDLFDGIAIYNALVQHDAKVTVIVDALAASAASFIAQAGDEVLMAEGSTLMIHDALAICYGNQEDMLYTASLLDKFSNTIASIYAASTGEPIADMRGLMQAETWMDATEAVDMGFATGTFAKKNEDAQKATNKWDLHLFNYSSRDQAPDPKALLKKVHNHEENDAMGDENDKKTTGPEATVDNPESTTPPPDEKTGDPKETTTPPAPPVEQPQNKAGFQGVLINGAMVTDPQAIQNHIAGLETFRNETKSTGRKAFVKSLVDRNIIPATNAEATEKFALSLDDDGYGAWTATFEGATGHPMFAAHGGGGSQDRTPAAEQKASEDAVQVLRDIVNNHKISGMKPEAIMETGSYKQLIEADPTYKL